MTLDASNSDLHVLLEGYQLLQLSAYSELYTGYALESGTFNLDSAIKITDSELNINNQILIDQLNLRAANDNGKVQFVNELTMPIDQALDLLRNSKNEIHLELPVTGTMNSPDFNIQKIINKALYGALRKASVSLLKNLLQPYSTAVTVAQIAGDQITRVRLNPIEYDSGQIILKPEGMDYIEKLSELMAQKPSLTIRLCGSTNDLDQQALIASGITEEKELINRLYKMAESRAVALKQHLVENQGIDGARLLACLPIHSEKAISGVELNI